MKSQAIFIFILYLIVVDGASKRNGKLSYEENVNRMRECGNDTVYWFAKGNIVSAATRISTRHFLTSTKLVMTGLTLSHNNRIVDEQSCKEGGFITIHKSYLGNLSDITEKPRDLKTVNGFIFCDLEMWKKAKKSCPLPMIIEVEDEPKKKFACLPSSGTNVKNRMLKAYSFGDKKPFNYDLRAQSSNINKHKTKNNSHMSPGDPLFKFSEGKKAILVGILSCIEKNSATFRNIQSIDKWICDATGICRTTSVSSSVSQPKPPPPPSPTPKKLNEEENKKRVKSCGKESVYFFTLGNLNVSATLISPRHLLTSTGLITDPKHRKWIGQQLETAECKSAGYFGLPLTRLANVKMKETIRTCEKGNCTEKTTQNMKIIKATIFCSSGSWKNGSTCQLPMVVEVDVNMGNQFSCLPSKNIVKQNDRLLSYGFYKYFIYKHPVNIQESKPNHFLVQERASFLWPGNSIFKYEVYDKKNVSMFVGIYSCSDSRNSSLFIGTQFISKPLCKSTGICEIKPKTLQIAPTNFTSETPKSSSVTPSSRLPAPIPPQPPRPKAPEEEPRKDDQLNVDEEYEEFLLRRKGWDEPDDFDNDLFRSKDFKTGSGKKIGFWMIFLVLVLVS